VTTTDTTDGSPARPPDGPVLLFDGVCNLCNGVVQFVIPRDPDGQISFAPLQSDAGEALLDRVDHPDHGLDSVVLIEGNAVYRKSTAAIRVLEILGWPYRIAAAGRLVPRPVRDWLYDVVADNRYDWFGKRDRCMVPEEDVSDRFLG
jgi:predicted DCC family thiol-disulfide oxidoreductase YuxK